MLLGSGRRYYRYIYNYQLDADQIAGLYGLIAHWTLDETSGSVAADSSPFGHDATISGGAIWHSEGRIDGCLSFDGIDGQAVNNDIGDAINDSEEVTVALWVKSDVTDEDRDLFDTAATPDGGDNRLGLRYDKDGWAGGGSSLIKGSISATSDNESFETTSNTQSTSWQHLALVWFSGSAPELYINGDPATYSAAAGTLGGTVANVERFIFGVGTKSQHWDGLIDDVRIYNRALCQDEIQQVSGSGEPGGVRIIRWLEVE